ncbi:MAG: hypothetical protein CMJ52_01820 [Planctomycetaceae bacterium]|nr:hypothetical protein [Planctomycetaceae bacterium]
MPISLGRSRSANTPSNRTPSRPPFRSVGAASYASESRSISARSARLVSKIRSGPASPATISTFTCRLVQPSDRAHAITATTPDRMRRGKRASGNVLGDLGDGMPRF